jgi:transcription elongation factor GreA-like protein
MADNPIPDTILIAAEKLRSSNSQKKYIRDAVISIIKQINEELKDAHSTGTHNIITDIPITFSVPNMSNKVSQKRIYSKIIEFLTMRGYRVMIHINSSLCRLKITWMSSADESELKKQAELIGRHTVNLEALK